MQIARNNPFRPQNITEDFCVWCGRTRRLIHFQGMVMLKTIMVVWLLRLLLVQNFPIYFVPGIAGVDFWRQAAEAQAHNVLFLISVGLALVSSVSIKMRTTMVKLRYMVAAFRMDTTPAQCLLVNRQGIATTLTLLISITFGLLKVDIRDITFSYAAACWL